MSGMKILIADDEARMRTLVSDFLKKQGFEVLWTSFYKIDKSRTREYGGTGLGLSIVKAIQQAHKNEFGVKNVKDGVEFWFDLDCVE